MSLFVHIITTSTHTRAWNNFEVVLEKVIGIWYGYRIWVGQELHEHEENGNQGAECTKKLESDQIYLASLFAASVCIHN